LTGGLKMGGGGLEQMPGVVKFVAQVLFLDPAFGARPFVRMLRIDGPGRIEITVRLLRRGKKRDQLIQLGDNLGSGCTARE
jgi:hypothetical protein